MGLRARAEGAELPSRRMTSRTGHSSSTAPLSRPTLASCSCPPSRRRHRSRRNRPRRRRRRRDRRRRARRARRRARSLRDHHRRQRRRCRSGHQLGGSGAATTQPRAILHPPTLTSHFFCFMCNLPLPAFLVGGGAVVRGVVRGERWVWCEGGGGGRGGLQRLETRSKSCIWLLRSLGAHSP